jgi:predicted dehydrogenase
MKTVRLGILGLGNMGSTHARHILDGKIKRCELAAVFDVNPDAAGRFPQAKRFLSSADLIGSGDVDAVLIATPHFDHPPLGIASLKAGLHVMIEKPIAVHKADAERLIAAHTGKKQVFAAMFQQRTDPRYQRLRQLLHSGECGAIRRVQWTITNWFRPKAYYDSGGWRATWAGEGGGVLLNQSPHQLDLFQWFFGMPDRVRAFCRFGRYHDIEVEDDVTAYMEYKNGLTATFITSTGEAPGSNRLEIAAERGKIVVEDEGIRWTRNEVPMTEFNLSTTGMFAKPPTWDVTISVPATGGSHVETLQNFIDAILDGVPLVASACEGINGVELANAMLYSSWTDKTIEMPLNGKAYERELKKRIAASRYNSKNRQHPRKPSRPAADFSASFAK